MTTANRDHRIDGHNAGLDRLADRFAFDDARRNFFDRVARFASNGTFAIEWLAKSVDDPAQKSFANGNLEQLAGGADLLAFANLAPVAQNDGADFGFFEIEREADDAAAEIDHFIQHGVA